MVNGNSIIRRVQWWLIPRPDPIIHRCLDQPGDRAELAGYAGSLVGENIAAALPTARKVLEGWLASPGHCANLMNPAYTELGAAYAVDPQSDAAIYWTAMFGAP